MQLGSGDVQTGSLDLVVQSQVVICSSPKVRPASVPDHQPLLVLRPTKTLWVRKDPQKQPFSGDIRSFSGSNHLDFCLRGRFFGFSGVSITQQLWSLAFLCGHIFFGGEGVCVCSPIPKSKGRKWKGPLTSRINAIYFHQNIEISPRAGLLVSKALTTMVIFCWFVG